MSLLGKKITASELSFSGAQPQNILYTITSLPTNGFVTVNSLPVGVGSFFTQEQINKGVVKYLSKDTNVATDDFKVEVKDFQGGFFASILTVNITVK